MLGLSPSLRRNWKRLEEWGCQTHSWLLAGAKMAGFGGFDVRTTKQEFPNSYASSSLAAPVQEGQLINTRMCRKLWGRNQ